MSAGVDLGGSPVLVEQSSNDADALHDVEVGRPRWVVPPPGVGTLKALAEAWQILPDWLARRWEDRATAWLLGICPAYAVWTDVGIARSTKPWRQQSLCVEEFQWDFAPARREGDTPHGDVVARSTEGCYTLIVSRTRQKDRRNGQSQGASSCSRSTLRLP